MMLDRIVLLGVFLLLCSITPISALERGSIENGDIVISPSNNSIEDGDDLTSKEVDNLYGVKNIHIHYAPPDEVKYICTAVAVVVAVIIIMALTCYYSHVNVDVGRAAVRDLVVVELQPMV